MVGGWGGAGRAWKPIKTESVDPPWNILWEMGTASGSKNQNSRIEFPERPEGPSFYKGDNWKTCPEDLPF